MEKNNIKYDEIRENGFAVDTFFSADPDCPTYGLNIALAWPFPANLKNSYDKLRNDLLELGNDVRVYPYERTHITVMTLVNFKNHQHPSAQETQEIENLIPGIVSIISNILQNDPGDKIKPFEIEIESPVLARAAAYLPISNPSGEIFLLRNKIAPIVEREFSLKVEYNKDFVHSTIMRFAQFPADREKFIGKFQLIADHNHIGTAVIDEFYLTSETKPYMRGGEKVYTFHL
jgi:hypothetical protein